MSRGGRQKNRGSTSIGKRDLSATKSAGEKIRQQSGWPRDGI